MSMTRSLTRKEAENSKQIARQNVGKKAAKEGEAMISDFFFFLAIPRFQRKERLSG